MVDPATTTAVRHRWTLFQRRTIEVVVALLAFAVWGRLAYVGSVRLLARWQGVSLHGHWILDVLSLSIGVAGSIAGASALWAVFMRVLGRTPRSLVGAPDDSPEDRPDPTRASRRPAGRP